MTLEALVHHYGLAALLVGAAVEGETVVVIGGLLAHGRLFPLPAAMAAAAIGSFAADQGWFFAGRRLRDRSWVARWRAKPAFARALGLLERYPRGFIFAFRFLYGFRTISPVAIGTSGVDARTFVVVNAVSATVWSIIFTSIGYLFGRGFEAWIGRLHPHGATLWCIVGGLIALGIVGAGVWRWRAARAS